MFVPAFSLPYFIDVVRYYFSIISPKCRYYVFVKMAKLFSEQALLPLVFIDFQLFGCLILQLV
jgi:hypothetical protein